MTWIGGPAVTFHERLQWGHGDHAVDDSAPVGEEPSLVKRPRGHGDHAVDDLRARPWRSASRRRFNGATAITPWMTVPRTLAGALGELLQWGHGDHAVDDDPLWSAGATAEPLQWGHGDHAVDDP